MSRDTRTDCLATPDKNKWLVCPHFLNSSINHTLNCTFFILELSFFKQYLENTNFVVDNRADNFHISGFKPDIRIGESIYVRVWRRH